MRVAVCPLLYGADYLREAAQAVAPHVDRVYILYTPEPSFGHFGHTVVESEPVLRERVEGIPNLIWYSGRWKNECQHRNTIFSLAPEADLIVSFDSDEIWTTDSLLSCIAKAEQSRSRNFLIQGFVHHWRSFAWACQDVWGPVRVQRPKGSGDEYLQGRIHHLGYAITVEQMKSKWEIHGHKNELRPEWMEEIYAANRKTDCHPCVKNGWWDAKPFPVDELPDCLKRHANFGKEVIV